MNGKAYGRTENRSLIWHLAKAGATNLSINWLTVDDMI